MYDLRENIYIIDESNILEPFEISQHNFYVESDTPALKVTMTYADTPGNPAVQTQHRINDLSLKVISPSNTFYWGNNGLLEGIWSTEGGNPDTKNTVECVYIENPESGEWIIEISADEIIEDSHVETTELDADYALVISPVLSGPYPPEINGPSEGDIGKHYEFTFTTTDPDEKDVYYFIDWDDGTYIEWTGPYVSGEIVTIPHTWLEEGNHSIKAKAKNSFGIESGWSKSFLIKILAPKIDISSISGGFGRAKMVINNIGEAEAYDIDWNITLNGGFILLGKESSGTIDSIPANGSVTIYSRLIIGFGETKFIATAQEPFESSDSRIQNGKIFGIYLKVYN
jgi:hypothetical protein